MEIEKITVYDRKKIGLFVVGILITMYLAFFKGYNTFVTYFIK